MIWLILLVVVVFLIASGMPLIRETLYEKRRRQQMPSQGEDEAGEPNGRDDGRIS